MAAMKFNAEKILAFLLAYIIWLTRRFPWIKSLASYAARICPLLTVRLRPIVDSRLRNPSKKQLPNFLNPLPAAAQNIYVRLKTIMKAQQNDNSPAPRKKLAFVSPMPPEQTGIAEYSANLIPALARYYDIEIITAHGSKNTRTFQWLCKNLYQIDRVLYHFGNSPFHTYMLELLEKIPGVVVLHDFFLSDLYASFEPVSATSNSWLQELYYAHGYSALLASTAHPVDYLKTIYPVNRSVLQQANGVIVHSHYSKQLARQWYREDFSQDWQVIPMLNTSDQKNTRENARQALGFKETDFLICSFGHLAQAKLNHRLLDAWRTSTLLQKNGVKLIFVGQSHANRYNQALRDTIKKNQLENQVHITGWIGKAAYHDYLAVADIAVQLRTQSRGETSAAVFDCMGSALPAIVNANGSFAELPADAVWLLADDFSDAELIQALETLFMDKNRRLELGKRAQAIVNTLHSPAYCAELYAQAIEKFYAKPLFNPVTEMEAFMRQRNNVPPSAPELAKYAELLAQTRSYPQPFRQLLVDVSATRHHDLKTGIERVVRGLLVELLQAKIPGYRVEPVYLCATDGRWIYRYANDYTLRLLNGPRSGLLNAAVEAHGGDLLLIPEFAGRLLTEAAASGLHARWREKGVKIYPLVHDLLPVLLPQVFPAGVVNDFRGWLHTVNQFDGAVCVSKTTATALTMWREKNNIPSQPVYPINWSHSGADIVNSAPSRGIPKESPIFQRLAQQLNFLMVGTIEPRKNHWQVLQAFSLLWEQGFQGNLIIIGKEGWQGLPREERRDILKTVEFLQTHAQLQQRLFWLNDVSDEYLEKIYHAASCLIAASLDEGFGLPLIEAARHHLPIIARDLSIFREIAGEHAYYFTGTDAASLAAAIQAWLALYSVGKHPTSQDMPWLTWQQSAANLLSILV